VIAAAVLAAGCEQWKAPKRIHELEDRVTALAAEVDTLKGKKPKAKPKPGGHAAGSGEAAGSGAGEEGAGSHDGSGEVAEGSGAPAPVSSPVETEHEGAAKPETADSEGKPDERHDDKRDGKSEGKPEDKNDGKADKKDAKPEDKNDGKADKKDAKPEDKNDGKADKKDAKPERKSDPAIERLSAVVAAATRNSASDARFGEAGEPHWSYEGKATGPSAWGALDQVWHTCGDGKAQSPIDIEPHAGSASPITFHYNPTPGTILDNGHTLQVNLAPGSSIEIGNKVYDLVQFHFHTPSEHTIAGDRYPLEVHLVHRGSAGKLAVIGVLYDAGPESKPIAGLVSKWPRTVGIPDKLQKPFDPSVLLPETRTVFRYTGSLTTPPCTEGVVWNVMRRTMTDGKPHLDIFGQHHPRNARDPQPLNERKIE
jgi:carbonic anhydrase